MAFLCGQGPSLPEHGLAPEQSWAQSFGGQRSEAHAAVSVPFGAGSREEPLLAAREPESSSPQLGQRHGFCQPAGLFPPGVAADWSLFLAQGPTWVGGAARQLARPLAWP